ncbi:sensor domain-containing diguanylate cyclase [Echinimonas agarilytica]|uniref:Diguanylate cyclase n=1 Tax=Echinimonas agarilytica TaxID=1215918 RepID=A0AA42B5U9_9GAMM|nr:diguanylate cyclase [Echinimonas agarilytica]MCM2678127.1 diguanylate cyclase [Echinimonas agarilytica]
MPTKEFDLKRHDDVFTHMSDCIIAIDSSSTIVFANNAAGRMFGYEPSDLVSKNIKQLMPLSIAEHHDQFVSGFGSRPSSIIGQQRQVMAKRQNGQLFPIELAVSRHTHEDNTVFVGLIRDITIRDQAESQSRERLHMLEMAEQMAGIGYWSMNLLENTVFWSLEVYKIHGVDPTTFEPTLDNAVAYYHPDDQHKVRHYVDAAIAECGSFEFELRIVSGRRSQNVRHVRCKGHVEINSAGQPATLFGVIQDISEFKNIQQRLETRNEMLQKTAHRLRQEANTDKLTGLPNRRSFFHEMNSVIAASKLMDGGIGMLMIDIDHFKSVNDLHGHDTGDKVLVHISDLLKLNTRGLDMVARLGGEEFVVLLPNSKFHHIAPIAQRYRRTVEEERSMHLPPVTISVGSTFISLDELKRFNAIPSHELTEMLLKQADQALYKAKHCGRNQVQHTDLAF